MPFKWHAIHLVVVYIRNITIKTLFKELIVEIIKVKVPAKKEFSFYFN